MTTLLLIKHSLPSIVAGVSPSLWHLSPAGHELAQQFAPKLHGFKLQNLYSSLEPKALETAAILSMALQLPYQTVADLHEHVRPPSATFSQAEFEANVAAFFDKPNELVFGSETADQAHQRFQSAVEKILGSSTAPITGVVAHGTVISLYAARMCGCEPFPLWKSLSLPSCLVLDLAKHKIAELITN